MLGRALFAFNIIYYIAGKFGRALNQVAYQSTFANAKLAISYQIAKFKSGNIFVMVIWGPTFNSHGYQSNEVLQIQNLLLLKYFYGP